MTCNQRTMQQQIADELAAVGDTIVWTDTGSKLTRSLADNGYGGRVETWTAGASFPCTVTDAPTPEPINIGERLEQQDDNITIRTPLTERFVVKDRIAVVGRGTFEVLTKRDTASLRFWNTYTCVVVDI